MASGISSAQCTLGIEITGLKNDNGLIMLQVFDENHNVAAQEKGIIKDKKCSIAIKNLKPGKYGIRYFHDENMSGKLESNGFGIPIEKYGFSNNAAGLFGPPSFNKWLFELKGDKTIYLKPAN